MWAVAATFYLAAFYLRTSPAVMTTELMRDFGISASQLGQFSAFYFYAYILMQIPTGVLVDSWGARRLLIGGSLAAAAGTLMFGLTTSYVVASIGRAIVGGSTAVGWVVTLKLATHWFPKSRFAMLSGLGLMMGNIGALFAQVPLRLLVEHYGWRAVALGSAASSSRSAPPHGHWSSTIRRTGATRAMRPHELRRANALTIGRILRELPHAVYLSQHVVDLPGAGRLRRRDAVVHRLVGPAVLETALRAVVHRRGGRLLGDDRVLGRAPARSPDIFLIVIGRRKPIYLGGAIVAAIGWTAMFYAPLSLAAFTGSPP